MTSRPALFPPRNAAAVGRLEPGSMFVASLVDRTGLPDPHVFLDAGRRYDWSWARDLFCLLVVQPGVKLERHLLRDLFTHTALYPTLVDFDRQVLASVVDTTGGRLKLWPRRRGSEPWKLVFAS